ncbi:DUF1801 domain-containing protein [Mucilaginibacter sp. HMF5004]|uniref:DUF1801 domain-containing protein n=1 Tax=Mucilaginibacter rivuli TaxID=2857527 RepID=UPI001C5E6DCC|nr:DUF1801 domain-containing protein [Mucilaginibacter rivuli]MBW4889786.1 DUF1801 domain-containing protein [Mucilaginibacter rivuli]
MAKNKTTETEVSVDDFISDIPDERKRADSYKMIAMCKEVTGFDAKMWGPSIIGFGTYHYKYESGHEGDMPIAAFSPRKDAISIYLCSGFKRRQELSAQLGKYKDKGGRGCIYIKKLDDVNMDILKEMYIASMKQVLEEFRG